MWFDYKYIYLFLDEITPETIVATDGGRYDVDILRRQKTSVYWEEESTEVRRCSWFYKGASDGSQYQPYDENTSTLLEEEFRQASTTNEWHRRVELPNNEAVVFHGPGVIVHFIQSASPADVWGNAQVIEVLTLERLDLSLSIGIVL